MYFNKPAASVLLLLLAAAACHKPAGTKQEHREAAPIAVTTRGVERQTWPDTFEALGTVRARASSTVAARVMAYVQQVAVREGDSFAAGQTLVTLDSRDLASAERQARLSVDDARGGIPEAESAIAGARAQLELAETTIKRMQDLLAKRSVSQQEFDEAASRVKVAQSAVKMAEARRAQLNEKIRLAEQAAQTAGIAAGFAEIKAPFAGRVVARKAEPGTMAAPGQPLLEIEQAGSHRLEAPVEESRIRLVRRGQAVQVKLDSFETKLTGHVSEIVPSADAASHSFLVKIDLPGQPGIQSGMFGRAGFAGGERSVLAIPSGAIATQGQLFSAFVAENGVARARLVRLGATRETSVEVLSGLNEGDRLIHPRPEHLTDGARIEVRP